MELFKICIQIVCLMIYIIWISSVFFILLLLSSSYFGSLFICSRGWTFLLWSCQYYRYVSLNWNDLSGGHNSKGSFYEGFFIWSFLHSLGLSCVLLLWTFSFQWFLSLPVPPLSNIFLTNTLSSDCNVLSYGTLLSCLLISLFFHSSDWCCSIK